MNVEVFVVFENQEVPFACGRSKFGQEIIEAGGVG
jgi:hypothetical protein